MWFNSFFSQKFFSVSIILLGLWLFAGVLWLTFTNNAQQSLNSQTAARRLLGPSAVRTNIQNRSITNSPQNDNDAIAVIHAFTVNSIPLH